MKKKLVFITSAIMAIGLLAGCGSKHTHEWGGVSYTWAEDNSTCTATRVCKGDESHIETETVDTTSVVVTEAKCEEDGLKRYTADFKTSEAFLDQTKDVTLKAIGHEWGEVTYTWADNYSSCTATRVCKNDSNHIESETADSAYTETIPATCDTNGSAVYDVAFENEAFEVQTHEITLPATGHSWGTPTYTWSNDYSSCTATRVCKNDPNHIESETVDSTSVETEASYLVEGSITYTATFTSAAFSTQTYKQKTSDKIPYYGEVPLLSEDGKTLTYGLYPQKNVSDSTLVSALNKLADSGSPETNGWYLYNDEYYAKLSATPYNSGYIYTFDNGTEIEEGTTYWFKCEPITWNVLSNNNGEYYILSSVLLDAHCYDASMNDETIGDVTIHPNNYEHSDIRAWLNSDFYNSAFASQNSYIQTTTVDNSASTTDSNENLYVCGETEDKVFLPSYQDYINSSYGFSTYESRYCKTTDWARARGAYYNRYSDYLYNGYYWTRSPSSILQSGAEYVNCDGTIQLDYTNYTYYSVRAALIIKIA